MDDAKLASNYMRVVIANRVTRFGVLLVGIILIVQAAIIAMHGGINEVITSSRVLFFVFALVFWYWGWPQLEINMRGLRIRNMFRTIDIDWPAFSHTQQHYGLLVHTKDGKKYRVAGTPARGGVSFSRRLDVAQPSANLDSVLSNMYENDYATGAVSWQEKRVIRMNANSYLGQSLVDEAYLFWKKLQQEIEAGASISKTDKKKAHKAKEFENENARSVRYNWVLAAMAAIFALSFLFV